MRIRTIKPEFWTHEDLARISDKGRLLAIALLNYADDDGYFNANTALVKAACCPLDESSNIPGMLLELSGIGYIRLFKGEGEKEYGWVTKFRDNQVINKHKPSKIKDLCTIPYQDGSKHVTLPAGKEGKGRDIPASPEPASKKEKTTWVTPYYDLWLEIMGGKPAVGIMVKAMKDIHQRHGQEKCVAHLRYYLEHTEAKFVSLPRFASTFLQWKPKAGRMAP